MTPTSQLAAPPDAKGRRIHLGDSVGQREVDGRRGERGGTDTRKADEASERHEGTSDGDQRERTTGQRVVGAGRVGGKHTQTPTTAADRQPDGKKGRLKIDLGPSLADASEADSTDATGTASARGDTVAKHRAGRALSKAERRAAAKWRASTGAAPAEDRSTVTPGETSGEGTG